MTAQQTTPVGAAEPTTAVALIGVGILLGWLLSRVEF